MHIKRLRLLFILILPFLAMSACSLPGLSGPSEPISITAVTLPTATSSKPAATSIQPSAVPTARPTAISPSPVAPTNPPAKPSPTTVAGITLSLGEPQPAPAGILSQLGVFQTGGGSGYAGADCENKLGEVHWCTPFDGNKLPLTETYTGTACGFASQPPLNALVVLPDGSTQPVEARDEPPYCWEVHYTPGPNAPWGKYQITVSQGNSRLSDTFQLAAPATPSGAIYQDCAWLAGLPPAQEVRLLVFGLTPPAPNTPNIDPSLATWRFVAERRLVTTPAGTLFACPDAPSRARYPEQAYLAYPPNAKPASAGDEDILQQFQGTCAAGPQTRLAPGKTARVQTDNLPLFSDPAFTTAATALLPGQTQVTIVTGPVCLTQGPWVWQVKTADGKTGWTPESDAVSYFLEPVP